MDIELIAESLCGADPALLLGGASGSAADVGLAGRAVAWLADVRSALFQTAGTNKKRQGSGSIPDHAERIAQLSKALDLVAGYVKASQTLSTGAAVNLALAALQEGAHLGKLLSSSQSPAAVLAAGFDGSGEEGAVEAVARAVRTKPPGGLLMIPTPFGLMILRRGGSGAMGLLRLVLDFVSIQLGHVRMETLSGCNPLCWEECRESAWPWEPFGILLANLNVKAMSCMRMHRYCPSSLVSQQMQAQRELLTSAG